MNKIWQVTKLFALAVLILQMSCKDSGVEPVIPPPLPLPDDLALFASIDGNWAGIQVFNANTLKKIDSLETTAQGVPFSVEFSHDYSVWYTILREASDNKTLLAINANTKAITQQSTTRNPFLVSAGAGQFLIAYYTQITEIFDGVTLNLIRTDSLGWVDKIVAHQGSLRAYALSQSYDLNDPGPRVVVYDLQDFQIHRIIEFVDRGRRRRMQSADLQLSPDGRYLFITVFNWVSGGGYGTFHAIDLTTDQVVAEYLCGKFSQMGVSPDGRYVYISDAAGYLYEMQPTGHLLRYDISRRTMEVFIDWVPYNLTGGTWGGRLPTDQVVIAPDNRTMYLTAGGQTPDGRIIGIMKIDLLTKQVLGIYEMPKDHRGYVTQRIVRLKLGTYKK